MPTIGAVELLEVSPLTIVGGLPLFYIRASLNGHDEEIADDGTGQSTQGRVAGAIRAPEATARPMSPGSAFDAAPSAGGTRLRLLAPARFALAREADTTSSAVPDARSTGVTPSCASEPAPPRSSPRP